MMTEKLNEAYELVMAKVTGWWKLGAEMFPNVLVALLIFLVFYMIGNSMRNLFMKGFSRRFASVTLAQLVGMVIKSVFVFIGLFIALGILGLDKTLVTLLAGAGVMGLAIGFAIQDIVLNLIAGVLLSIKKPYRLGDVIEVGGNLGTAKELSLKHTVIVQPNGVTVTVPNKDVLQGVVKNYNASKGRRIELTVGVGYDSDLDAVKEVILDAIGNLGFLKAGKKVDVFANEFGDSSINFVIRYWIDVPFDRISWADATHAGVVAIKKAFDKNNIDIPFPIRTLLKTD